jgi:putative ABC transport system permease protein
VGSATGLFFGLELSQKKQSFAVIKSLGASDRQLNAFIMIQSIIIIFGRCITGFIFGFTEAEILVKILTGIFDPPPDFITIPFGYIALTLIIIVISTSIMLKFLSSRAKNNILKELKK